MNLRHASDCEWHDMPDDSDAPAQASQRTLPDLSPSAASGRIGSFGVSSRQLGTSPSAKSVPSFLQARQLTAGASRSGTLKGKVSRRRRVGCCRCTKRVVKCIAQVLWKILKFIGWTIIRIICRRRLRRAALERNQWITFKPRPDRLDDIAQREAEYREHIVKIYNARGLRGRTILYRLLSGRVRYIRMRVREALAEVFGARDPVSGVPNDLLERYRLLNVLGEGPHGQVFSACWNQEGDPEELTKQELKKGRLVAIRIRDKSTGHIVRMDLNFSATLLRNRALPWPPALRMLRRLLARLRLVKRPILHETIVKLQHVEDTREFFIEVLEYLPGGTLYQYLEKKEMLDEYTACRVSLRILKALDHLHARRLLHRDLRLQQFVLAEADDPESCKLADLWCLAALPRKKNFMVEEGRPCDLLTAAPEVVKQGEFSAKSDVWAAGCVIFELLHGHPPFGGTGKALVQRICLGEPEFSELGTSTGGLSENALDLLRWMLQREPGHRPSVSECLKHPWFEGYNVERPSKQVWQVEKLIRHVKLWGKPPHSRQNLPASNLLASKRGAVTPGFCTYMGATSVDIDFEVIGKTEEQQYWVTKCLLSLWGREENPRQVQLKVCVKPGAPWVELGSCTLDDATALEASIKIDKPIRYVRISLRGNLGGHFGIAVRKVSFYGYQVRQVPIALQLENLRFLRGSRLHTHASDIHPKEVTSRVHKSLQSSLRVGRRIEGTGAKYRVYEDICSGSPHITTAAETPRLKFPRGVVLVGAVLGLRYVSDVPSKESAPPRLRIQIVKEAHTSADQERRLKKTLLFATEDLTPPSWKATEVLGNGYVDYPVMFATGIRAFGDDKLHLEVLFQNFSGTAHIPADMGLSFFYVPELQSPSTSEDEGVAKETAATQLRKTRAEAKEEGERQAAEREASVGQSAAEAPQSQAVQLDEDEEVLAQESDAGEGWEEELQNHLDKQVDETLFGNSGLPFFSQEEGGAYRPSAAKGQGQEWWKTEDDSKPTQAKEAADVAGAVRARPAPATASAGSRRHQVSQMQPVPVEDNQLEPTNARNRGNEATTFAVNKAMNVAADLRRQAAEEAEQRQARRRMRGEGSTGEGGDMGFFDALFQDPTWSSCTPAKACNEIVKALEEEDEEEEDAQPDQPDNNEEQADDKSHSESSRGSNSDTGSGSD